MNDEQALTTTGMLGWLALVLVFPLLRGRFTEFVLVLFIPGIAIADMWSVVPEHLHKNHDQPSEVVLWWTLALLPYALVSWVIYRKARKKKTTSPRD